MGQGRKRTCRKGGLLASRRGRKRTCRKGGGVEGGRKRTCRKGGGVLDDQFSAYLQKLRLSKQHVS